MKKKITKVVMVLITMSLLVFTFTACSNISKPVETKDLTREECVEQVRLTLSNIANYKNYTSTIVYEDNTSNSKITEQRSLKDGLQLIKGVGEYHQKKPIPGSENDFFVQDINSTMFLLYGTGIDDEKNNFYLEGTKTIKENKESEAVTNTKRTKAHESNTELLGYAKENDIVNILSFFLKMIKNEDFLLNCTFDGVNTYEITLQIESSTSSKNLSVDTRKLTIVDNKVTKIEFNSVSYNYLGENIYVKNTLEVEYDTPVVVFDIDETQYVQE